MLSSIKPRNKEPRTPGSYTDAEIATVRAALALSEGGQDKTAQKLLVKKGLKPGDVLPAIKQANGVSADDSDSYEASDVQEVAPRVASQPADDADELAVEVPATYGDSVEERAKLIAVLWRKYGEGWQVESFDPSASSVFIVRGRQPSMRPHAELYSAGPSATVGNGEAIAASHAAHGRTMLGYDPYTKRVETAVLPPATIELRNRLLRKNPKQKSWELELVPIFGVRDGEGHLAKVIITRADQSSPDRDKETAYWLGLAKNTIGHSGWWVSVDDVRGVVEMTAGVPISIPPRVGYDYDVIKNGKWGELVVGRDGYNKPVVVDLAATPHALVVGRTGSGKSIFLQTMIFSALAHGFELAILDPTKRGLDFRWARPYAREGGWGCQTYPEALEALKSVYEEAQRRLDILDELSVPKWSALSPEDQAKYGIRPILVVVDEGTSMSKLLALPKTMDKDDPEYVAMAELNAAKERILMYIGKILRECRFVGVHLIFGTQRFGVQEIGQGAGEMREQMGARIVLGRSSTTSLSMACADPQDAAAAYEQAHGLAAGDSDPSATEREATPGRGLAEIDGRGHVALQGAFAPVEELIAQLDEMGIPSYAGDRRPVVPEKEPQFGVVEEQPSYTPAAQKDVYLGEIELSFDDLELDAGPAPAVKEPEPELDWSSSDIPVTAAVAAPASLDDDDPFSGEPVRPRLVIPVDDDDPFPEPAVAKPKPKHEPEPKELDFEW